MIKEMVRERSNEKNDGRGKIQTEISKRKKNG